MLGNGSPDLEGDFRAAYFDYRKATDSLRSSTNVNDDSAKGIASRNCTKGLKPLRAQISILAHQLSKTPDDPVAFDLYSKLTREYAIASNTNTVAKPGCFGNASQIESMLSNITGFDLSVAEAQMADMNSRLEFLLRPPKPKENLSINNAVPRNHAGSVNETPAKQNAFVTAKSMMGASISSNNNINRQQQQQLAGPRSLGVNKRPRFNTGQGSGDLEEIGNKFGYYNQQPSTTPKQKESKPEEPVDERLAGIEPKLIEMIKNEIQNGVDHISWDDIAGLEHAKNTIKEIVIWPMLRPDIFTGLRGPPKGLLLFGPPGTGKTMIGKCIASQAKATFFSISASSLTSKWVGEGEKLVRALFAVARCSQPAVIFIDEIDSLLTQRSDGEFEASRRIKTEFLVQFDGASTSSEDRILVIGATNRPQEIDEAARRRLVKRLYIPLPDCSARTQIVKNLLGGQNHDMLEPHFNKICERTDGYSGSDMDNLCREAALGPIRSIRDIMNIDQSAVRPISLCDFEHALTQVRASVSQADLAFYLDWNRQFGSIG